MRILPLLALIAGLAACGGSAAHPPPLATEGQARQLVQRAIGLAQAERFEELCQLGGGNCERILADAGPVPRAAPEIASVVAIPHDLHGDGAWSTGGQLVTLCGNTDEGDPYVTQMLVFVDPYAGLLAAEPIFWSGNRMVVGSPATEGGDRPFVCPG